MNPSFRIYFNQKKQWADVYLHDVHPDTFASWRAGRWGYFIAEWESPCSGHFGSLHFVTRRLRIDTICHELDHLRQEWLWANRKAWTGRNEEGVVEIKDKLLWAFLREMVKIQPKIKVWMREMGEL